ncbi:aldose 1-epimerase family protein [Ruminococcaceae bacterium OttesenSCG-928-A11]|nr:aldose 1-epimerase family protein [Ruminococcaceae bacterium OttesenSCG-928-A11]
MRENYIGHESQLYGVEEHRLVGGKGDGMRLFEVKNGLGLAFTVAADRCADIYRLSFKGDNFGFFSAGGYVGPAYYDDKDAGWLKSFTAGFLTTCGLLAVGSPTEDAGEKLPLHGAIANQPAEHIYWEMDDENIRITAHIRHAAVFAPKLLLKRTIDCSKVKNEITLTDTVKNVGDAQSPLMLLYHFNMGYPLLSEQSEVFIPSAKVTPRNDHAAKDADTWMKVLPPTAGFEEQCYFHRFDGRGAAGIYSPAIGKGLVMDFDPAVLDQFTQWKMLGVKDYVLGLEPGNCTPDGRDVERAAGRLKFIDPGQAVTYSVRLSMADGPEEWARLKQG